MEQSKIARPEYPRPDFQRERWMNLNGLWGFAFDDENIGEKQGWQNEEVPFVRKIVVPFCYQSQASGIFEKELHENLWYRRVFDLPEELRKQRVLLRFGAVDTVARVWLNGVFLGEHHGGYSTFDFDITETVKEHGNVLVVKAEDSYECSKPRGKQHWGEHPDRCWYTATSGIWQTVWLEGVGEFYLDSMRLTPDVDRRCLDTEFYLNQFSEGLTLELKAFYQNKLVKQLFAAVDGRIFKLSLSIREEDFIDEIHYWTPEAPNLYDLEISLSQKGEQTDHVKSYFGMRKISVSGNQILLNNRPYYQKLILDQGYWPESLMTPPDDRAIQRDILLTKELGFNGARKHQKIEDPRYYYWADRLGLLVWGEMPSGYAFDEEEIESVTKEWMAFIKRDYNHPCIITWVPLNESWGVRNIYSDLRQQAFGESLYQLTKALDSTRLISTNDGWEQVRSDLCGIHDYAGKGRSFRERYGDLERLLSADAQGRMLYAQGYRYTGGPILITEYGGIAFESTEEENWGYNSAVKNEEEFLNRYQDITGAIKDMSFVCGYCYTQLTDVEQEVNGLADANRNLKAAKKKILKINQD